MQSSVQMGTIVGTGAAIAVTLGWVPDHIKVVNVTDADQMDEWYKGMAQGSSIQTNAAVATRATNGLSTLTGATGVLGFTIGSGISEVGKSLTWIAMRQIP